MLYTKKRVMRVPIIDKDNKLLNMLKNHKKATNAGLKAYRKQIAVMATITDIDRRTKFKSLLQRRIYAYVNRRLKYIPRSSYNLTAQNTIVAPLKEFTKRKGNRKRPPRFRRMDLRLRQTDARLEWDAKSPTLHVGFRNEAGRGAVLHPFTLKGSERYFSRFKGMEQTVVYLTLKKNRLWASIVFSQEVPCKNPETFLGLDAGMYSNKNAWYPALVDCSGTLKKSSALTPVSAEDSPQQAAKLLTKIAKDNNAAIVVEDIKSLNRGRSGLRFGIPTADYMTALYTECVNQAIAYIVIDPAWTSKVHSKCDTLVSRPKKNGWTEAYCPHCDEEVHADKNAAINIACLGVDQWKKDMGLISISKQ